MGALTFRHCAGDVLWRTTPIDDAQVASLLDLYADERKTAWHAGDMVTYRRSHEILEELMRARFERGQWRRASNVRAA